jgi:phenylacetate-CoA ligase
MDWEALYHRVSATIAFDRWLGYEPGARMAYLWCAMQDMPEGSSLKKRVMDRWVVRKRFYPATEMEEHVMERYWRELRRFRPVLLQAYATPLALFARFLLDRGLSLSIPAVSSCAETLSPDQRALIGEALGAEVYDWYGAREAGRIATECEEHQGMHVNAYGLHVEVVDAGLDHGVGEILVSDLWNVGMPMLRYAIGDLGSLDHSPCACGRALPRLSSIAGRTLDVFVNAHGRKVPGVVFPNRFVKDDNTIREMQIVQEDYSRFRVLLVPGREYGEETRTWLSGRLDEFMHQHNDLRVELVDRIPREASGKVMFCKREFDPEELGPAAGA